jgi:general secretion pathway protein B
MSYILEALRKADAERERGAVPDIHTQPLFATDREEAPARPRWVVPVLAASVVLLLGALAFVLLRGGNDATLVAGAPQAAPGSAATVPGNAAPGNAAPAGAAPASAASAGAAPGTTAAPPAPRPGVPQTLAPAAPAPTGAGAKPGGGPATAQPPRKAVADTTPPEPARKPAPAAGSPAAPGGAPAGAPPGAPRDTRGRVAATGSAGAAPGSAATATAAAERVHALNELPDDVRRAVPNFTFGGAVYSDNAANRMLIINGQLFNEGGQPSAGVVLDQIRLKSAVFRYRGYRYEMPY